MGWTHFVVLGERDHEGHTLVSVHNSVNNAVASADAAYEADRYDGVMVMKAQDGDTLDNAFHSPVYSITRAKHLGTHGQAGFIEVPVIKDNRE